MHLEIEVEIPLTVLSYKGGSEHPCLKSYITYIYFATENKGNLTSAWIIFKDVYFTECIEFMNLTGVAV